MLIAYSQLSDEESKEYLCFRLIREISERTVSERSWAICYAQCNVSSYITIQSNILFYLRSPHCVTTGKCVALWQRKTNSLWHHKSQTLNLILPLSSWFYLAGDMMNLYSLIQVLLEWAFSELFPLIYSYGINTNIFETS